METNSLSTNAAEPVEVPLETANYSAPNYSVVAERWLLAVNSRNSFSPKSTGSRASNPCNWAISLPKDEGLASSVVTGRMRPFSLGS